MSSKQKIVLWTSVAVLCVVAIGLFITKNAPTTIVLQVPEEDPAQTQSEEVLSEEIPSEESAFATVLGEVMNQLEIQNTVDADISAELASKIHTFKDPLVILDPYGISPLTALAVFCTDEPSQIELIFSGKDDLASVEFTFDGLKTEHLIPIYGLYPESTNEIELRATNDKGEVNSSFIEIETTPLPDYFKQISIRTFFPQPQNYSFGMNYLATSVENTPSMVIDANGDIRWGFIRRSFELFGGFNYGNGTYIKAFGDYNFGGALLVESTLLGRYEKVIYAPYGAHHDIAQKENGNLLLTGSKGERIMDLIYEIDAESGEVLNELDLKSVFQQTRNVTKAWADPLDWFHLNAITIVDDSIIVSGRSQSVVARLDWPSGNISWISSPHNGWLPMFSEFLLEPTDEVFNWHNFQHAPEVLPDRDNDPDTIDVLMFDNGTERHLIDQDLQRRISNGEINAPENYSRILHLRINEREKTVKLIWEYGRERGQQLFSDTYSSAVMLDNENYLGLFSNTQEADGAVFPSTIITEVTPEGSIVWEAYLSRNEGWSNSINGYRIERLPLYLPEANEVRIETPVVNLIPEEILDSYGY